MYRNFNELNYLCKTLHIINKIYSYHLISFAFFCTSFSSCFRDIRFCIFFVFLIWEFLSNFSKVIWTPHILFLKVSKFLPWLIGSTTLPLWISDFLAVGTVWFPCELRWLPTVFCFAVFSFTFNAVASFLCFLCPKIPIYQLLLNDHAFMWICTLKPAVKFKSPWFCH